MNCWCSSDANLIKIYCYYTDTALRSCSILYLCKGCILCVCVCVCVLQYCSTLVCTGPPNWVVVGLSFGLSAKCNMLSLVACTYVVQTCGTCVSGFAKAWQLTESHHTRQTSLERDSTHRIFLAKLFSVSLHCLYCNHT